MELGSGKLEIDSLTGNCIFEDEPIKQLPIALELSSWVEKELSDHRIVPTSILRARLVVRLSFSLIPWDADTKESFFADGKIVRTEKMHQCSFDCQSEVATDETVYQSAMRDVQEWPLGWPRA